MQVPLLVIESPSLTSLLSGLPQQTANHLPCSLILIALMTSIIPVNIR